MCGIIGAFSPVRGGLDFDIQLAIENLHHRGPDDRGTWKGADAQVALAHARLSLVGPANGHQPLCNEHQTVVAVVNGEFYGHREIRHRLETLGHCFQSDSDSEIAIHLYEEYGLDFVKHLRGEFSLLLWDQTKRKLLAVRDRFGIKPLVYHQTQDRCILFASEAKALLPWVKCRNWDRDAFLWAASFQYLPQDRTLFEAVHLVPPGHVAIVDDSGFRLQKYWDHDYPAAVDSQRKTDPQQIRQTVRQTRQLLENAVLDRLAAEAPLCFHVSGGLDSSSALGIASRLTGKRQTAFTVGFPNHQYDESDVAAETAQFCNAELHHVLVSENDLIDHLSTAAKASEGLAINGHLAAKYILNQAIHRHGFKAAITGEGADEVFLSYEHLSHDWWQSCGRQRSQDPFSNSDRTSVGIMLPHGQSLSTDVFHEALGFCPNFLKAKATLGFRIHQLLRDDMVAGWRNRDAYQELLVFALESNQLHQRSPIHQSAWLWSKLALAGYILKTLGDGTEMASSIEGRLPFLDHHLFEYVRDCPIEFLLRGKTAKHLLREAVRPYVTDRVYRRTKHPFASPPLLLNQTGNIREFLFDLVDSQNFRSQPFFCEHKVKTKLNDVLQATPIQRQVWDPAFVMLVSLLGVQELLKEC